MEFTVNDLQDFLKELTVFNMASEESDSILKKDLEKLDIDYEEKKKRILGKYSDSIAPSVSAKKSELRRYESKLLELNKSEANRQQILYAEIVKHRHTNAVEVERLRDELFANYEQAKLDRAALWKEYQDNCANILQARETQQNNDSKTTSRELAKISEDQAATKIKIQNSAHKEIEEAKYEFLNKFNPAEIENKYAEIYAIEPFVESYKCSETVPESIRMSTLMYDDSTLGLQEHAISLLQEHYSVFYRNNKINMPFDLAFDEGFRYLFEVKTGDDVGRKTLINQACSLAMRLFMTILPNRVNFTFFDPISLGDTFARFGRLVDPDDRTNKVINGKIWTSNADIDERLRVLTDHIANVTQRCLQNTYTSIKEYNKKAGQNAEPYQVLMIMDFPAAFKEDSLRMLEQIMTSGPKCGVYTVILKSDEQVEKIAKSDNKLNPIINNIEAKSICFSVRGEKITLDKNRFEYQGTTAILSNDNILFSDNLEKVISTLKEGIKNKKAIKISFKEMSALTGFLNRDKWQTGDCSSELVIPIGIRGVDEVQNLTFGFGGYHALIAGQIGSGKSTLLHTIIMSALLKYSADQLQVFLVDFKRGVEFKVYANHILDMFRVVAVESEREFGSSVLEFLEKEQIRRADKFKRENVDNVHDYRQRTGEALPRILLIIDEFHVLFSKDNDIMSKNASAHLETIIRQGRAFGIHVILASQTMTNVGGIHHGVWGQVGIRIALKCPKADARFILGADNDAVDLLSPNDPGQAVYNSDCGNVINNSIFRVSYIEQKDQNNPDDSDLFKDQESLLENISISSQKLQRVKKLNLPETRVMLSNVEDNIYNPFQKFARGENIGFNESRVLVGESLQLFNTLKMTFKTKASSNMLIIGNDDQKARTMFTFCALSLALNSLTLNNYKKPSEQSIFIVDYAPMEDFYEKDILIELVKLLPAYVKYVTFEDSGIILDELYSDLSARKKNNIPKASKYFMLFGLQRARDLRSNDPYQSKKHATAGIDDGFGLDIQQKLSVTPYDEFLNILQSGAANGIHSIIWEDNFKTFMAHYSSMLANFDMRVGFTMSDDDSVLFMEEPGGSQISENNAVFSYNGNQKFRPYKKPDLDWLKNICNRITNFQ